MNTKYELIEKLKNDSLKHKSLSRSFIRELSTFLESNLDDVKIVSSLFKLDTNFYRTFCKGLAKNDDNSIVSDNSYYKNFARLIKFRLIHKNSSNFPKGLSLISINPNAEFLLSDKYKYLDLYIQEKELLMNKMINNIELTDFYIYLRFFSERKVSKNDLSKISFEDIIIVKNNLAIQYMKVEDFLGNHSYDLYIYDKFASNIIFELIKKYDQNILFSNIVEYEKNLKMIG